MSLIVDPPEGSGVARCDGQRSWLDQAALADRVVVVIFESAGLRYPRVLRSRAPFYQAMYSTMPRRTAAQVRPGPELGQLALQ
jgi:hypothetical protein